MIDRYLMQWRCRCRTDYGLWIFSGVHFLFFYIFLKESFLFENGSFLFCAISTILKNSFCVFLQFLRFSEKSTEEEALPQYSVHYLQVLNMSCCFCHQRLPFYQEIFFSLKQLILLCALSAFLLSRNNLLAGQRVSFLADWFPNLNGQSPWVAGTPVGRSPE